MTERRRTAERISVMGCQVDNLSMQETVERVAEFVASGDPHQHVVINAAKVVKARDDPALREIINGCDLINADGMSIVWAAWLLGRPLKGRVAGIDLFYELVSAAARRGWPVFFLGAREAIVRRVVDVLGAKYPELQIAGYRNGYWSADEEPAVAQMVARSGARLLFVAISSPKKEEFLGRYCRDMGVAFAMGVGGTFDVVAGKTKRAPVWMQRCGLEWLYRFAQEPVRMFRRYTVVNASFTWLLIQYLLRIRRD